MKEIKNTKEVQQVNKYYVFWLRIKRYFSFPSLYFTQMRVIKTKEFKGGVWTVTKNYGEHMLAVFEFEDKNPDLETFFREELSGKILLRLIIGSIFKF